MSDARILVLGAGFGGLELTSRLSEQFGDGIEVTLIDQSDAFVLGFSKLDVMFGYADPAAVRHPYARSSSRASDSFRRSSNRSTPPPSAFRPAPGRSRQTCLSSLSAPTSTRPSRRAYRGRSGVLYGGGSRRRARCDCRLRRWPGDRWGAVDAVQVPAGPERDRVADAPQPRRARAARSLRDRTRRRLRAADPALAGRVVRVARRFRGARHLMAPAQRGVRARSGPQRGNAPRRR